MKKTLLAILAIALLFTMLLSFASCGESKPEGKYGSQYLNLEFDGDKISVNLNMVVTSASASGTYQMDGDRIVITYEGEDASASLPTNLVYDAENDTIQCALGTLGNITLEKVK